MMMANALVLCLGFLIMPIGFGQAVIVNPKIHPDVYSGLLQATFGDRNYNIPALHRLEWPH